jgi:hypothetical protein
MAGLGLSIAAIRTGSGGFSPATLFANSEEGFWFEISDLSTVWEDSAGTIPASVDGPVGRITDKSGRGRHATQGTTANKPTLRSGGGLYWLEWDGFDDGMLTASYAFAGAGPHSAAAGFRPATVAAGNRFLIDADDAIATPRVSQLLLVAAAVPTTVPFNTGGTAFSETAASLTNSTDVVLSQVTNTTAVECFKNGATNGSTAVTGTLRTNSVAVTLGKRNNQASSYLNGRTYILIQLARAFTAGERASVESYCASKSGVTL